MKPNNRFVGKPFEFWANVRTISEKLRYTVQLEGYAPIPEYLKGPKVRPHRNNEVRVPTLSNMVQALAGLKLSSRHVADELGSPTDFGQSLVDYFEYRAEILNRVVQHKLMNAPAAKLHYDSAKADYDLALAKNSTRKCRLPGNNQKGAKKAKSFLACLVNMAILSNKEDYPCNYDPQLLTKVTKNGMPFQTLARRVDGTFPTVVDPIAVWEVKEYYYTTTFGSRIADGVYVTMLDGMELEQACGRGCTPVEHLMIIDSHYTWWVCGKSYLCRIVDMMHMGLVDEVLFGSEVVEDLPGIVRRWVQKAEKLGITRIGAQAQARAETGTKEAARIRKKSRIKTRL